MFAIKALRNCLEENCKSCCDEIEDILVDKKSAVTATVCSSKDPALSCIERKCSSCGTELLKAKLDHLLTHCSKSINWYRWVQSDIENKDNFGIRDRKIESLIQIFLEVLESLALHMFVAQWQQTQFKSIMSRKALLSLFWTLAKTITASTRMSLLNCIGMAIAKRQFTLLCRITYAHGTMKS